MNRMLKSTKSSFKRPQSIQSQHRSLGQEPVEPLRDQHRPRQHVHVTMAEHPTSQMGEDVDSSQVKKTRGITRGLKAHDMVKAVKRRIPIWIDAEQKLPKTIEANAMFTSEIGSLTRKHAPLTIKTWKKISNKDKNTILTALSTKFEFDSADPDIKKHIEYHMGKSYRNWKGKLHKYFKLHADNLDYARAHPPPEKLWGKRQMAEWEYLCDELFTEEKYQKRSKINADNRKKLKYNHCGGSRPFLKHMEAALEKGKDITIVENWGIMHQHQGGLGGWVNEEAENIGKKMLDELEKEKEKLAQSEGVPVDEISIPFSKQLCFLEKGVGVMKGKSIKGLGFGLQKQTCGTRGNSSTTSSLYTNEELLSVIGELSHQIEKIKVDFANYKKANKVPPCDDDNDIEMSSEEENHDLDKEDHTYMY